MSMPNVLPEPATPPSSSGDPVPSLCPWAGLCDHLQQSSTLDTCCVTSEVGHKRQCSSNYSSLGTWPWKVDRGEAPTHGGGHRGELRPPVLSPDRVDSSRLPACEGNAGAGRGVDLLEGGGWHSLGYYLFSLRS